MWGVRRMRWLKFLKELEQQPPISQQAKGGRHVPKGLLFQWHITERCNLKCTHCYQESNDRDTEELEFERMLEILEQYRSLLDKWRKECGRKVWGQITVTGGEPFVRKDFLKLLETFQRDKERYDFAILSNGSFIDKAMAQKLKGLGPRFVQLSIEGDMATHDDIRGKGSYQQTVQALKHLVKARVQSFISFTAHRGNFKQFPEVAKLGRKLGVTRVWSDRLIPQGSGKEMSALVLTPEETKEFFSIMSRERSREPRWPTSRRTVSMHRALQFLEDGGRPYRCSAGGSLVTVLPNGDLLPCRRMPVVVGNLLERPLEELYYSTKLFQELRNKKQVVSGCEECFFKNFCQGGLKCLAYALTDDPFSRDPGCFLRNPGDGPEIGPL